jgi:hypothetical protein
MGVIQPPIIKEFGSAHLTKSSGDDALDELNDL